MDHGAKVWQKSPKVEVVTTSAKSENAAEGPIISLQAVYDATQVALRVEWADPTESNLKNAWTWDGSTFSKGSDEDRFMIHFPISNDPQFSTKGCAAICHNQENDAEKWYMAANSSEFTYDQWHWKSTRTNPVGQADDKWLGLRADPADTESAHYGDGKDGGGEMSNENDRRNAPLYMNSQGINSPYILSGQEVPLDVSSLKPGMVVPGYILSPVSGSRGDISANGQWSEGKWILVLVRPLDTGHADDVIFTPPKPVPFGIAAADNGGGYDHLVYSEVLTLVWK